MGENAAVVFCFGKKPGETANSGPGGPGDGCTSCGCDPCKDPCDSGYQPPYGTGCPPFLVVRHKQPAGEADAQAGPASDTGSSGYDSSPSNTTKVSADIYQGSGDVYGVNTVGGRQILRTLNGALDLRWHLNQGFASDTFAKYPATGSAEFDPAGKGASFGFLHWLKRVNGFPADRANQFYSVNGGMGRDMVSKDTDQPLGGGNPNQFNTVTAPYFKYDAQQQAYYWYNNGDLGNENPLYVSKIRDGQGYTLYYTYENNRLQKITGDVGQLIPYFGYDANFHIDRVFLQDTIGNDHRATYYGYDGSGALSAILDPVGGVSYFMVDSSGGIFTGYKVSREVDPAGVATYLVYDSANNYLLNRMVIDGRVTYFADDGRTSDARSAAQVGNGGPQRDFRRIATDAHGYGVSLQTIGGSATYYEYGTERKQIIYEIDPNGNKTSFQYDNQNFRTVVARPNGGTLYFAFDSSGVNATIATGPRHLGATKQATYFQYLSPASGLRTAILNPLGQSVYFGYDARNRMIKSVDARGGATYYGYNAFNLNNATLDALNNFAYFAYNANGMLARRQDALGRTTYFTYDQLDQQLSTLSPTGDSTTYERNKRGQIARMGESGGRATYYGYDPYYNTSRVARLGSTGLLTTYWSFDDQNNATVQLDPNEKTTYWGFDARSKQIRTLDAAGGTTYYVFDPAGNQTNTADQHGTWTLSEFDVVNAQTKHVRGVAGLRSPSISAVKAHWNLNEGSGTRADDAGSGNTLNPNGTGGVGSAPGIIGTAAEFVKSNSQFLNASSSASLSPSLDLTLSAWINLSSLPALPAAGNFTIRPIAAKWSDPTERCYSFCLYRDGNDELGIMLLISNNGSSGSFVYSAPIVALGLNQWRHVAASFNHTDGRIVLFMDGVYLFEGVTPRTNIHTNSTDFTVGANATMTPFSVFTPEYFDGMIDELSLYDQVLNQKQISQLAQQHLDVTFANDADDLISTYYAYDLDGNRTTSVNERGYTSYFGYDLVNRLAQSRDALGNATYFAYDPNSNQTQLLNARGYATYFGYDLLSRQTQMLDAAARASYFGYDAVGNRVKALYPGVQTEYFGYDASNRLVQQLDRGGFATYYGFDIAGNQDRTLNARAFATYFQFDILDRNIATLDALRQAVYFEYDPNGNRIRLTDHVLAGTNCTTYFGYDALNRMVRSRDPLDRATYYAFDAAGNQVSVTLPGSPVQTSYFGYDRFDRMVQSLAPTNDASYFGYDPAGNMIRSRNPRGFAAYFGYDALNRREQTLDARQGSTYFAYDANGNLARQVGVRWKEATPAAFTTYFGYDALDRLAQTTDALGNVTQRGYDTPGNLYALKPAVGGTAYFYYDPRNQLTRTVDGVGNETLYAYDQVGNRTIVVTGDGSGAGGWGVQAWGSSPYGGGAGGASNSTYFGYDALNRLAQVLDAEGGTAYFGYDIGGNTDKVRDALARATYFGYDKLDRLTQVLDALNQAVYFGYDAAGNRNAEMDALARSTYYQYDIGNRLHAVLDPLNKAAYYGYDANSNLARTLDNNRTAVYFGYDALDRRTAIQYPAETQYFGYDAAGNLVQSRDNWGGSYFGYDTLSRLAQRRTPRLDTVYYGYDGVSNLLRLQYPQDHAACYYGYDDAQRLSKLLSSAGHSCYYTYDASSNVTRRVMGNGVVSYATFDRTDRMLSLRYATSGGVGLAYFDYNRDVAGRILRIQREATAGYAIYYAYDQIDRLEAEVWRKSSDNSQVYGFWYSYDAANNRLQMRRETTSGVTWDSTYYQYAADNSLVRRQVATPPSTVVDTYYGYDANGALTQVLEGANATYFGYGANQLVTRILPPSEAATYFSYDGRLNRYYIDKAGTQTYYLWDGLNQLEERDGSGTLLARYTQGNYRQYGIGSVVEIERHVGAATYYQYGLGDHRGTFYKITDQNQDVQIDYTLDAFGRQIAAPGGANPNVPNDLIYQTNWLTLNIGGRAYGVSKYRLYDAELGIFLSRDFLRYLNKYRAWSNTPTGQVDRDGLSSSDEYFSPKDAEKNAFLADVEDPQTGDTQRKLVANYQGEFYPLNEDGSWRGQAVPSEYVSKVDPQKFIQEMVEAYIGTDKWEISGTATPAGEDPGFIVRLDKSIRSLFDTGKDILETLVPNIVKKVIQEVNRPPVTSTKADDIIKELKRRNEVVPEIGRELLDAIATATESVFYTAAGIESWVTAKQAMDFAWAYLIENGFTCVAKEVTIELELGLKTFRIRADGIASKELGGSVQLYNIEIKGNKGRFTKNQKPGFPLLAEKGGRPVGGNAEAGGLAPEGGKGRLGPTVTILIRVEVKDRGIPSIKSVEHIKGKK